MTDLRKAAEMALETLDNISESGIYFKENPFDAYMRLRNMAKGAMLPLQKALAQPEKTCCCDDPNVPEVNNHD